MCPDLKLENTLLHMFNALYEVYKTLFSFDLKAVLCNHMKEEHARPKAASLSLLWLGLAFSFVIRTVDVQIFH